MLTKTIKVLLILIFTVNASFAAESNE